MGKTIDSKQRIIFVLLIIAIIFSVSSIAISLSLGTSPAGFNPIQGNPTESSGNIGIIINDSAGVVGNGNG